MGTGVGNLTRPGVEYSGTPEVLPPGGYAPPRRKFFDTQDETMAQANEDLTTALAASPMGIDPTTGQLTGGDRSNLGKVVKPSFSEVAAPGTKINSGETKLGKLMHILTAGVQGGIAGRAASERAVVESGGRRNGGFATGAMAAIEEPQRQRRIAQQIESADIQNQQNRAETEQRRVLLPWLLKNQQLQGKHLESQIAENEAQAERYKREPTDKVIGQYVNEQGQQVIALQKADGTTYEQVLGKVNQKTPAASINEWTVRAAASRGEQWAKDLLQQRNNEEARLRSISNSEKPEKTPRLSPYQSAQIEDEKQTELKDAEEWFRNPKVAKPTILDKKTGEQIDNPDYIPDEDRKAELERRKAQIQSKYEGKIVAGGGSIAPKGTPKAETSEKPKDEGKKATPPMNDVKYYKGKKYVFNGKEYVLSSGAKS